MDPRRFDSLARSFATPRTRRGFLGALASLGAGLLGGRAAAAQVTQASCGNVVCYNRGTRTVDVACAAGCVCCVYANGNSRCRPPGGCTGGVIVSPPTTTTTTTAAPTCASGLAEGAQCGPGMVCLDGACAGNGVCANSGSCPFGGFDCGSDTACVEAGSLCVCTAEGGRVCVNNGGLCFDPETGEDVVSECATSADCPSGSICLLEACSNDDDTYAARCKPVCGGTPV